MTFEREQTLTEFTATPIRFADYVRRPEWEALPMQIKIAVVHVWQSEHCPPSLEQVKAIFEDVV